jgi:hypothetical protein
MFWLKPIVDANRVGAISKYKMKENISVELCESSERLCEIKSYTE